MSGPMSYQDPEKDIGRAEKGPDSLGSGSGRDGKDGTYIVAGEVLVTHEKTTERGLKSRHAQMIALGGSIGTGLFVGSGQTLARGGPIFILGSYIFMSFLVLCLVSGIGEVAAWLPVPGCSMNMFGHRYVSRTLGFSLGWLYFYSLGILVPYEITAAGLVINYWNSNVHIAVWISIMIVVIVGLNLLPVKFYGETEFWFAGMKVIMMLGLLAMSFILFWGGGPSRDRLGFRYWKEPGPVNTYLEKGDTGRFLALLSTFILTAFPFAFAPELLVATGGEMESPRRNLPTAARRYIWRLIVFYVGSVLAIGLICPSNDARLTSGAVGAGSSPFVVAIKNASIPYLDSIINGGIILSAWSSGNSFMFLSSRSLYALSMSGNAPAFFRVCSGNGVPYRAVGASAIFCALAYLNVANDSAVVFNWFVNLTNTSCFISWVACGIIHIRFRKACRAQGITLGELPYYSKWLQPWGSYVVVVVFTILCFLNGFATFWSVDKGSFASSFLTAYVGIPLFFVFYFGHRFYARKDRWARLPEEVNLHTGLEELIAEEKPQRVFKGIQKLRYIWE